jgi:hypothetical protein
MILEQSLFFISINRCNVINRNFIPAFMPRNCRPKLEHLIIMFWFIADGNLCEHNMCTMYISNIAYNSISSEITNVPNK